MRGYLIALLALAFLMTGCAAPDSSDADVALTATDPDEEATTGDSVDDPDALAAVDESADESVDEVEAADADGVDQARLCEALSAGEVDPGIVDLVPEQYRASMAGLAAIPEELDADGTQQMIDIVAANPTLGIELRAIIDSLEGCDPDVLIEAGAIADMFMLWNGEPTDEYCGYLAELYSDQGLNQDEEIDFVPDSTIIIPEHLETWNRLAAFDRMSDELEELDHVAAFRLFSDTAGLGLYAEGRCGQADAFATSFVSAAFVVAIATGEFGEGSFDLDLDDDGGDTETTVRPEPDPDANGEFVIERVPLDDATTQRLLALLPTDSTISGFERVVLDFDAEDNPGRYVADAIVPTGWVASDFFGVSFEPDQGSGVGFFTDLSFDASCQGLCAATDDWPDRFLSFFEEGTTFDADEALVGPTGRLVVTPGSLTTDVRSARWSDTADHMFVCRAALDGDEDLDLVALFSELCRLATARWL